MSRILVVYGTSYGQTAKIARFVADTLTASGHAATLVNAAELGRRCALPRGRSPRDFDGVIVGSSIIVGHHQRSVRRFVRAHHAALNAVPSAFFSVSGSAASRDVAKFAEALKISGDFARVAGWRPLLVESVAGAIAYTKYSPPVRWLLRRISASEGGPTDTSRDHELTDWAQVGRFVEAFEGLLPKPAEAVRGEVAKV
jgi:menaquinone-dependent protoporphyrinogen oxidase